VTGEGGFEGFALLESRQTGRLATGKLLLFGRFIVVACALRERKMQLASKRGTDGTWPTVYDVSAVIDTHAPNLSLFVSHTLIQELCITASAVGRTGVSHGWRYEGHVKRD
jgi:hypothetical protein